MGNHIKGNTSKILTKVMASTVAIYMLAGNFVVTGMGLGQVFAENITQPQTSQGEVREEVKVIDYKTTQAGEVYKGFLYVNETNGTNYQTTYTQTAEVTVRNTVEADRIEITQDASKYIKDGKEVEANITFKATTIPSETFYKVFGIDGYIDVMVDNEKYATIRYAYPDDHGDRKYVVEYAQNGEQRETDGKVEYPEGVKAIRMVTSKPVNAEVFTITTEKQLEAEQPMKASEIKAIKEVNYATGMMGDTSIAVVKEEKQIEAKEPTTQASVELSNHNISTLSTNKVTATIKLNDTNSSCKLLEAGNIVMTLPAGLASAKITNAKILYGNGMSAKAAIKDGKIVVTLSGKQTRYDIENISGGVNIVLDIEMDMQDAVPTHKETLTTTYQEAKVDTEIQVVSKAGLLMLNNVSTNKGANVTSIDNVDRDVPISIKQTGQTAKQTVTLVNNYDKALTNVEVVGNLGYKDDQTASTFESTLAEAVKVNGANAEVYYSKAVKGEDWTKDFVQGAKAYKVVLKEEVKPQAKITVTVNMNVPDKLTYNAVSYVGTHVTYAFGTAALTQSSTMKLATEEKKQENLLTISAENQKKLSEYTTDGIKMSTLVTAGDIAVTNNDEVYEGQILRYTIIAENTGNTAVNGLRFQSNINNACYYEIQNTGIVYTIDANGQEKTGTEYVKAAAGDTTRNSEVFSLGKGEKKTYEFQVVVNDDASQVDTKVSLLEAQANKELTSANLTNNVKQAKIKTELKYAYNEESEVYSNGTMHISYKISTYDKEVNNVKTLIRLPEELELLEYQTYGVASNIKVETNNDGNVECTIDKIGSNTDLQIIFICKTKSIDKAVTSEDMKISATTTVGGETYTSNNLIKTLHQSEAGVTMHIHKNFSDDEVFTQNKDGLEYTITLKNNGAINLDSMNVLMGLDKGLTIQKVVVNGKAQTISSKTVLDLTMSLASGQETTIQTILGVNVADANKEDLQIITEVFTGYTENLTNTSTVKVKKENNNQQNANGDTTSGNNNSGNNSNSGNSNAGSGNNNTGTNTSDVETQEPHSISGVAWLDSNRNGKRDDGETLLNGITVTLVNAQTGDVAKDENGNDITTTTDDSGKYTFKNVANGKYAVMFEFDTERYAITTYQKNGVSDSQNSDAIMTDITVGGTARHAGITDNLQVKDNALSNIDIGLVEGATFDLSLDKQIASITITNEKGTKTTEYNDQHLAKVDLVAKYMNNTDVIITYKFIIKNEGEVTGYVGKLVDILPSGLEFSSELNKEWYVGSDGNLYTTSLSGIAIEPGASTEVELVLTKSTTENTTGQFTNNAELQDISNIEAIAEKTNAVENNKSSADVVISIKTGSAMMYLGITLGSMAVIAAGAYIIKKKVMNKGI